MTSKPAPPDLMTEIAALTPEPEELPDEELARRLADLRQGRNSIIVTVKRKAKPKVKPQEAL
jgi:hypothetical protein